MALVPFPSPGRPDDDDRVALTDADAHDDGSRMSFLEHLDELRKRLICSVYALVAGCAIAFIFVEPHPAASSGARCFSAATAASSCTRPGSSRSC